LEAYVPLLNQTRTQKTEFAERELERVKTGTNMNMQIYAQESKAMTERSELPVAERNLWVAILLQALEDWQSGTLRRRKDAERFFFHCERDFAAVCRGAGLDPSTVLAKLQGMRGTGQRALEISWERVA
jgi:hypothetical protein